MVKSQAFCCFLWFNHSFSYTASTCEVQGWTSINFAKDG